MTILTALCFLLKNTEFYARAVTPYGHFVFERNIHMKVCEICGSSINEDNVYEMDGQLLCADCYYENTRECDCCGDRIWCDDDAGDDNISLCSHCRENHYTVCDDCGRLIHDDDACYFDDDDYAYCRNCYERRGRSHIHCYSFKPEPIFYGDSDLYMGVELELDRGGETDSNAERLLDIANADCTNLYIKRDGSLDEGMELVTHPMSLDYHCNEMPWEDICHEAVVMGYRSHKTGTCGLHVHVNRNFFGDDRDEQEIGISRVLFFVERFWQELLKFSRRTEAQINRWAARYGMKDKPKEIMDHAKKQNNGRYACVNLCNYSTIEFRMFRGTLKYNTLIATLQLVSRICNMAVEMTDDDFTALSWPEFVSDITEPELICYLKERRLYVNEPINEEEDD